MKIMFLLSIIGAILLANDSERIDNEANFNRAFEHYSKKEYEKARILWEKSCENNHTKSCFDLALLYESSNYENKNYEKAVNLYDIACNKEHALACNNLALMYSNGKGVRKNIRKAKELFEKSCELGISMACESHKRLNTSI